MKKYKRGSSTISVELLGDNTRFLACIISAATIAYCIFVGLLISGVFVPVPRILSEIMPFAYSSVVSWTSRCIIMACDLTCCALILAIFSTLTNQRALFYIFFIFLCAMVVIELLIFFVYIYYPMQQLPPKLTKLMINLMNDDVKLMKRKGVDNLNTLEEMNNQPIAKLQRRLTCCGVESIRDWEIRIQDAFEKRLRNQTIPISCCWQPHQKVKYFCTATEAYKDTCLSRALFYLHRYVMNTSRVMTIIFCLQLIFLAFYWKQVRGFFYST